MSNLSAKAYLESKGINSNIYSQPTAWPNTEGSLIELNLTDEMESYHAAAMAEGSESFDPAKHLSGWVKSSDSEYETTWLIGNARLSLVLDNVYVLENDGLYFHGHIPTASFFHALCGALNITP